MTARAEPSSLRSCLRDGRGRPVPFINVWSAELPEASWRIAHDVDLGAPGVAVPPGLRGCGEPDFTRQAPDRQRRCTLRQRCQVCCGRGEWLAVSQSMSTKAVALDGGDGGDRVVITEPWLCRPCADYALNACPGLIGRRRRDDLLLVRPTAYALGYSSGWLDGPLADEMRRLRPAIWGEIHLRAAVDVHGRRYRFLPGPMARAG